MSTFDLGNLVGGLIKGGAPILGTVLGTAVAGPLGGAVGGGLANEVINMAGKALGIDIPTVENVETALATTKPEVLIEKFKAAEAEAAAKWPALAQIAVANAEVAKTQIEATRAQMQAELDAAVTLGEPWRTTVLFLATIWRPLYALEGLVECAFFAVFIYRVLAGAFFRDQDGDIQLLLSLNPIIVTLIVPYMTARFALVGYYMKKRTDEKIATTESNATPASAGIDIGNLVGGLLQAVIKKS